MSATTTTPAPEVTVSAATVAAVKSFVQWEVKTGEQREQKLQSLVNSLRDEFKRGVSRKLLTAVLIDAGMDAGNASNLLTRAEPPHEAAKAAVLAAEAHNATAQRGQRITAQEMRKIAKGEGSVTVETVIAAKTAPKQRAANPEGTSTSTSTASNATLPKLELPEATTRFSALVSTFLKDGGKLAAFEAAVERVFTEWKEKIALEKAKSAAAAK